MPLDPNDIYHNGYYYSRNGGGGPVSSIVDPVTGGSVFSGAGVNPVTVPAGGLDLNSRIPSTGYQFHGFAGNQSNADRKFYDYSGALGDAAFQAQLTTANAWANSGFITCAVPSGSGNLMLIACPALSFDYKNGDSLLLYWRGRATPQGADATLIANTVNAAGNGIKVYITPTGKAKLAIFQANGALTTWGSATTGTVAEAGVTHDFLIALDGGSGRYCAWVDGVRDYFDFATFGVNGKMDVSTSNSLLLGGDGSANAGVQNGIACQHQSLVILGGRRGLGAPSISAMDKIAADLHRNPQMLVSAAAW